MPTSTSSPLSYQTTMPEMPDVSYQAYRDKYGYKAGRLTTAVGAWINGEPNYSTWRTNELDKYNMQLDAYNTWLSSGAGLRASAESGGYNPNYFGGSPASSSPLSYQDVNEQSGAAEMAQGIAGIFSFAQALQGMKMTATQIAGQQLKNGIALQQLESAKIQNKWLDRTLGAKAYGLGYSADAKKMQNETELASRYFGTSSYQPYFVTDLGNGVTNTYDLFNVDRGFGYQRASEDLAFLRAGTKLRQVQTDMIHWNTKEKKFFVESMLSIKKTILEHQRDFLKGQLDWQPIEQKLRKQAQQWNIGLSTANTAISAAKTALQFFLPIPTVGGGTPLQVPYSPNAYNPSPWEEPTDYGYFGL